MLTVSNEELKEDLGDTIECHICFKQHPIEFGEEVLPDGTRRTTKLLAFFVCSNSGKTYLAGINGKSIRKTKPTLN